MNRSIHVVLACVAGLLGLAMVSMVALDHWLTAAPDEWAAEVRVGPLERRWQVARAARVATLPVVVRALEGRAMTTAFGTWTLRRQDGRVARAECRPCSIRARALGGAPLRLSALAIELDVARGDDYAGRVLVGDGRDALPIGWRVRLDPRGLVFDAGATAFPIAALLGTVQPRLPELDRARVEGTVGFTLRYGGDPATAFEPHAASRWLFEPKVDGFRVSGLGTEVLATATPPERCGNGAMPLHGWLPIAVLAAEDQSFASHPGFDAGSLRGALLSNAGRGAAMRGGSTLTQQLAKLVYTGDERDPVRKLRELLHAVEMERTLGKARILQLYLAIAPWGPGVCGAERAARLYLGKPAARVDPLEAAWLAGLLRNPRHAILATVDRCGIDAQRTAWVLDQMRPMALWRRNHWLARVHTLRPLPATRSTCPLRVADALPTGAKPSTNR